MALRMSMPEPELTGEDMPMRRYGHPIPQRQGCRMCGGQLWQTNCLLWEQNRLLGEILARLARDAT